jgi:RecJ-like exonuclease
MTSHSDDADGSDRRPVVYDLAPDCTETDVAVGNRYHAVVNGVVEYGIFVDISDSLSGLVHESKLDGDYDVGDRLVVHLDEMRENGDLSFVEADIEEYRTLTVEHEPELTPVDALETGDTVTIEGSVTQIKQTAGPTVFRVCDETGIVACTAFEEAGVRAYPEVDLDDIVRVDGDVGEHEGSRQIEVENLTLLDGDAENSARQRLEEALAERAEPRAADPLVEWEAFEKLRPDLEAVARRLRRTVLEGRPIRVRHHADGDGMCASLPVQLALERFIEEVHDDDDAARHLFKRLPSKAPFYEMEDVTRATDRSSPSS